MRGNYEPDQFTKNDVLVALDQAGLRHQDRGRYILAQCPLHEDRNASAQIYTDDWFVKCHAGCEGGRFHITKAFPQLRGEHHAAQPAPRKSKPKEPTVKYQDKSTEIMHMWKSLPEIPADHDLHTVPADILNEHGWRYDAAHERYLIPYFSRSKTSIPFAQWRNLHGDVRFNFWKDTKPTMYGTWNLSPGEPIFLVEGTSDAMVMDLCAVPWIAAPSAASGELVKAMAGWCQANDVTVVFAGDNDDAGSKLRDALDESMSYRVRQPRHPYKDWGEMLEAEGVQSIIDYTFPELFPDYQPEPVSSAAPAENDNEKVPEGWDKMTDVERVQSVFPGAVELEIVDKKVDGEKKQLETPSTLPF